MKKNLLKKISVAAIAFALSLSMVACGEKKTEEPAPAPTENGTEAPAEENDAPKEEASSNAGTVTVEDYKAKMTEIFTAIQTESTTYSTSLDPNDTEATITATKEFAEKVKPYYEQLAALEAPEEFADEQAKIKTGAEASVEALDLSVELMELEGDPDAAAKAPDKLTELNTKMTNLQQAVGDFQTAIATVMAE